MIVCVCHAVSEEEVLTAVESGARSVGAVTRACRAGGDCGACHETIAKMVAERESSGPVLIALRTRAA
jgi:bacterioferritin-associated ferredoxin